MQIDETDVIRDDAFEESVVMLHTYDTDLDRERAKEAVAVARHRLTTPSSPAQGERLREAARWRPEVIAFADLMERQLRANDHKPGWKNDDPFDLHDRVQEECDKLSDAVSDWMAHTGLTEAQAARRVAKEAADVANMAMMVADVCGCLLEDAALDTADNGATRKKP